MKRATCQGHSCSSASCPPTILPARAGPSIPQVAFRSTLVPFLVEAPVFLTSLIAHARLSSVAGTTACLGLYLLRSQPAPLGESHGHCGTKKSCNKYLHLGGVQYEPPH